MKTDLKSHRKLATEGEFTNLTGMQLLNRGCDREAELIKLGFVWNRDAYSYIQKKENHSNSIRQINLLAYDDAEWNEWFSTLTPSSK